MGSSYPFEHPAYAPAGRIAETLRGAEDILVTAHVCPDGDAVGAMLAMGCGLERIGKRTAMFNVSEIPEHFQWLSGSERVYARLSEVPFTPRLAVVLDCGDASRLGGNAVDLVCAFPTINMDHHLGNPLFGSVDNWVEPRMAATGQMTAAVLAELGVPLSGAVAEALYVSLNADTGCFSFENTTPECFELVAHMMRQGLDVAALRRRMDNQWTLPRMRLWAKLLQDFSLCCGGRAALAKAPQKMLEACGAGKDDLDGFVEHMRRLRGVVVAVVVREDGPGRCKISLRSTGSVNVQAMAAAFGGGGHRNAAGAFLNMPLDDAAWAVANVIRDRLE